MEFGAAHLGGFRVGVDFGKYFLDLLLLQVDNVVHHALSLAYMLREEVEIKLGLRRERILHISIEVDGQQTAGIVGTQGYLAAWIGGNGAESEIGVAVGHRFAGDGVPEKHARLGRFPCVVDDFRPESLGVDLFLDVGILGIDGELLYVGTLLGGGFHEFIVDAHRHIGAGHFSFGHLGVDKCL